MGYKWEWKVNLSGGDYAREFINSATYSFRNQLLFIVVVILIFG